MIKKLERKEIKNLNNISGLAKQHATYFFKAFGLVKSFMPKTSNKAQKTDAIKVAFRLIENEIANPGDKEAYIVLKNPTGMVINAKGTFMMSEGNEAKYTDQTIVNYENADLDVVMLVERKGDKYESGVYPIEVFVEGKLVGSANLELNDSFLGL